MHEVIISEKPKSAEKIAKALSPNAQKKKYNRKINYWEFEENGKKTTVLSAVGHLYSLTSASSRDRLGFDLTWVPAYEVEKQKYTRDYINAIKKLSKGADKFVHACDYDVEGTLIGYNALKYACGNNAEAKASRMKFSTLTKKDIVEAYNTMRDIDIRQVDHGIARHMLDYYYGMNISSALMKAVRASSSRFISLSAGRVQTPTLSILVDREKEIQSFVPEPYWMIKAKSDYDIIADHVEGKIFDEERAKKIYADCQGADADVTSVKVTESIRKPPIPFNLGGLQSEAHTVFGFSPKRTQVAAQNLYVGGYTSYPRTSSQKLPESLDFKNIFAGLAKDPEFKKHIFDLPAKLKPNEGKKTDAAHPAIHPTGVLPSNLSADEAKIYSLIVYRFISVFSENSKLETMKVNLKVADEKFTFSRKRVSYEGWLKHYPFKKQENDAFPPINKGDQLKIHKILVEEKETKPPARYNEASLIKELEKRELGTKATRADIVAKLYDRKYIEGKKIEVKPLGINIIDTLNEYCKDLTSEELTREFERELEGIDTDKYTKEQILENGEKEVKTILAEINQNKKQIGEKLYGAYQETNVVGECSCGGKLIKRYSPRTKNTFVGCSNFPKCKVTYSLPKGANMLKKTCPTCGLPMISIKKASGKGRDHVCLDSNCGKDVSRRQAPEVVGKCPECGKDLLKRSGRYGEFVGCSGFPRCRFTCSVDELNNLGKDKNKEDVKENKGVSKKIVRSEAK
ncbi:DNA topoisomerase I TopA [Methanobrevibacter ruminantium M1]|uniref:DNA topoisomerase 1 n=1 Tax=Methanobrevibacter ruminantium (strain ATCC 35063 / DSM 1093 / JCM 13430 / OCM 146 / M1) TaxID=634498 RepID=D3E0J6_METRM|nr:DNA topoisomerase I [Methanobrevibacter ruminantium]ADC46242.1 DNA topoisomerase I TopA [Methanobrevibacter ruminantium M1]